MTRLNMTEKKIIPVQKKSQYLKCDLYVNSEINKQNTETTQRTSLQKRDYFKKGLLFNIALNSKEMYEKYGFERITQINNFASPTGTCLLITASFASLGYGGPKQI